MTGAAVPSGAWAQAPQAREISPGLQSAGRTRLRVWGFEVYDAALAVAPGFRSGDFAAHAFALELNYLRNFSAAEIARVSIEQMRRHGSFDAAQGERWQSQLTSLLPSVKRGDRLTGIHRPGRGAQFVFNGTPVGELADPQFSKLFFSIWLGASTSEPAMRQALLEGTVP